MLGHRACRATRSSTQRSSTTTDLLPVCALFGVGQAMGGQARVQVYGKRRYFAVGCVDTSVPLIAIAIGNRATCAASEPGNSWREQRKLETHALYPLVC